MSKWRTPAGMTVQTITLSGTGGPKSKRTRDFGVGGDGQWFVVKYPNGVVAGQVRTVPELAQMGIDIASLEEVSP